MAFRTSEEYRRTWDALRRHGLLVLQDAKLPSLTTLVSGKVITSSWKSHPAAAAIDDVSGQLSLHPEVLVALVLSGKITYVHRTLWPAFLSQARSGDPWQKRALPPDAVALLRRLERDGEVDPDATSRGGLRIPLPAIQELQRRLLIHVGEVRTADGSGRVLETWDRWADRVSWHGPVLEQRDGRSRLLEAVRGICRESGATCRLPWEATATR